MPRDPELVRILRDAISAMERASGPEAELAIIAFAAGAIERYGDDGSDALSDLSDYAIQVRQLDPDRVQGSIARGINPVLDERAERQATVPGRNGAKGKGHRANGGVGQGRNGVRLNPDPKPEWSEPDISVLRLNRRAAPKLPLNVFGDHWGRWIENAAEAAASPPDYVAAALLSAASALIGHSRWGAGLGRLGRASSRLVRGRR